MENEIKFNEIFTHKKSGKQYKIISPTQIKSDIGAWVKGVIYAPVIPDGNSEYYVRRLDNFLSKFSKFSKGGE